MPETLTAEEQERAEWAKLTAPVNPIRNAVDHGDGIPAEHYLATQNDCKRGDPDYVMSRGELMEFAHCPHRWLMGYKDDKTDATSWGTLVDCIALGSPDEFNRRFAVAPATYKAKVMECPSCGSQTDSKTCRKCKEERVEKEIEKEWDGNSTYCREWREDHESTGRQVVRADIAIAAENACKFLFADEQIRDLIHCSRKQVMVTGEYLDADTGLVITLKGLIDLVPPSESAFGGCLADLKTCNSAAQRAWARAVFDHGYAAQAALYLDLWNAAKGEMRQEFRHILQESYAPWEVGKRMLSSDYLSVGRSQYLNALKRYATCLKEGHWPGYDEPRTNADIVIDGWVMAQPEAWMIMAQ